MKTNYDFLDYHKNIFALVDKFHFNSEVSFNVYQQYLDKIEKKIVPITHRDIIDRRKIRKFDNSFLTIGFIGNDTPYKGLDILIESINGLPIILNVWGGLQKDNGNVKYKGKFKTSDLPLVFDEMDLLVVPSIWQETFSLVTLEALSFGVPVLVSSNVGAQDIVKKYMTNFVYNSIDELKSILQILSSDRSLLIDYNTRINQFPWEYEALSHANDIVEYIYK